mmetsp:Transcript_1411/g.1894  ORF Transcript_1411/g.1894 Transcript_1411/m.1894 type:complete len:95 (+) Transcript_1411:1404-1688(+)
MEPYEDEVDPGMGEQKQSQRTIIPNSVASQDLHSSFNELGQSDPPADLKSPSVNSHVQPTYNPHLGSANTFHVISEEPNEDGAAETFIEQQKQV